MHALHNTHAGAALPEGRSIIYIPLCPVDQKIRRPDPQEMMMIRFLSKRVKAYRDYRTVMDQLSHMSVHELDDIGITRADIERIARGAAR
jgi:uncharacterized protein YjiS (DUF1127 family)